MSMPRNVVAVMRGLERGEGKLADRQAFFDPCLPENS